jgi:hypothetical protein
MPEPFVPKPIKGVVTNPPPSQFMQSITHELNNAMQVIPPGTHTTLVFSVDTKAGVNLAVVSNFGTEHVRTELWIGKTWDEPVKGGAKLVASW